MDCMGVTTEPSSLVWVDTVDDTYGAGGSYLFTPSGGGGSIVASASSSGTFEQGRDYTFSSSICNNTIASKTLRLTFNYSGNLTAHYDCGETNAFAYFRVVAFPDFFISAGSGNPDNSSSPAGEKTLDVVCGPCAITPFTFQFRFNADGSTDGGTCSSSASMDVTVNFSGAFL